MNPTDPATWTTLGDHPVFGRGEFDPNWYDGDSETHLQMLRSVATELRSSEPRFRFELVVLDDCTMYVAVTSESRCVCNIYPSETGNGAACYFLDIDGDDREIRVVTNCEVVNVLRTYDSRANVRRSNQRLN